MIGRIAVALTWLLLAAAALPSASGAAPAPVLAAGSDTVHVGDVFSIPVKIANVAGLSSFQFDLSFSPTILTVLGFTDVGTDFETAATAGGGSLTGITGFTDNTTGLLGGVADSISGLISGNGLTPAGVLVEVEFQALSVGVSPLTLSNAFLTDDGVPLSSDNGDFALQNGQVTVIGPAAAPEPGALLLLSFALAFAFCVHRWRKPMRKSTLALAMLGPIVVGSGAVTAQTFQNGPYYAKPSWDQQIPAGQRFIVLSNWSNQAVLDRETGLVWERTPSGSALTHWNFALTLCAEAGTGNRRGWRTPSIQELASLIDPANGNMLPAGSPFQGVAASPNFYWSATSSPDIFAWVVAFGAAGPHSVATADKTDAGFTWCVRSGSGPDSQ